MKFLQSIVIFLFVVLLFSGVVMAHSVTARIQFELNDMSDVVYANGTSYTGQGNFETFSDMSKHFISSENDETVVSLISLGPNFMSMSYDSRSTLGYIFSATQNDVENEFAIVLTRGNWSVVDTVSDDGIISSNYAGLGLKAKKSFLKIQYDDIDITKSLRWTGSKQVVVKNVGRDSGGIPRILLDVK